MIKQLLGGRPMTLLSHAFVDKVSGRDVYYYVDGFGRCWMAESRWAWFRVKTDVQDPSFFRTEPNLRVEKLGSVHIIRNLNDGRMFYWAYAIESTALKVMDNIKECWGTHLRAYDTNWKYRYLNISVSEIFQ